MPLEAFDDPWKKCLASELTLTVEYTWHMGGTEFRPCVLQWWEWIDQTYKATATWANPGLQRTGLLPVLPVKRWTDLSRSPATTMFDDWHARMYSKQVGEANPSPVTIIDKPSWVGNVSTAGQTRNLLGEIRVFSGCRDPRLGRRWTGEWNQVISVGAQRGELTRQLLWPAGPVEKPECLTYGRADAKWAEAGPPPKNPEPDQNNRETLSGTGSHARRYQLNQPRLT